MVSKLEEIVNELHKQPECSFFSNLECDCAPTTVTVCPRKDSELVNTQASSPDFHRRQQHTSSTASANVFMQCAGQMQHVAMNSSIFCRDMVPQQTTMHNAAANTPCFKDTVLLDHLPKQPWRATLLVAVNTGMSARNDIFLR
jgi:hypothetical protein